MNLNPTIYLVFQGQRCPRFCSAHASLSLAKKAFEVLKKRFPRSQLYIEAVTLYDLSVDTVHGPFNEVYT